MNGRMLASYANWAGSMLFGILAFVLTFGYLTGRALPIISDDRSAFLALAILGFLMCSLSIGTTSAGLGWTHPITVLGLLLGVVLSLVIIAMLVGWPLPFITTYRAAFIAVAWIGLVKWVFGWVARLLLATQGAG
jgi:hypothetical protein